MMFDKTTVVSAALAEGISDLRTAMKKMNTERESFIGDMDKGLSSWEGDAKQAYEGVKRTWNQTQTDMENIINKMASTVSTIADNYDVNEKMIQGKW